MPSSPRSSKRSRLRWPALPVLLVASGLLALGPGVGISTAATTTHTVKVGRHGDRAIVVTGAERAVYRRSGEGLGKPILCTGVCTQKWPPLTVPSATTRLIKGAGVTGTLSKVRRPDGRWQVRLRGYPLYRFSPDHSVGDARGQGSGGVWWTLSP